MLQTLQARVTAASLITVKKEETAKCKATVGRFLKRLEQQRPLSRRQHQPRRLQEPVLISGSSALLPRALLIDGDLVDGARGARMPCAS